MTIKKAFYILLTHSILSLLLVSCATKDTYKPYSIKEKVQSKWSSFEKCLNDDKKYRGLLTFTWEINAQGKAHNIGVAKDQVKDKDLVSCFSSVLRTIRFSTFGLNYKAKVKSYTFVFSKANN